MAGGVSYDGVDGGGDGLKPTIEKDLTITTELSRFCLRVEEDQEKEEMV